MKAVITGDIVESTKLTAEDRAWLIKSLQRTLKTWDKDFGTQSEIYRGDSFQCLVHEPMNALRLAVLIRTYIRSLNPSEVYDIYKKKNPANLKSFAATRWMFDARMAIGIGQIDKPTGNIKTSDGEAFQLSGRELDTLKSGRQMMAIRTNDEYSEELDTEIQMLDFILGKATAMQCEVINLKLLGYTEIEIAKDLKIGQSAVNQRSVSGGWNVINRAVDRFEAIYRKQHSKSIIDIIHEHV